MLVQKQFDMGEMFFEITQPYIPDKNGALVQSKEWMVTIHNGTVSWFSGGVLRLPKTNRTALFPDPPTALKAAVAFAVSCGLKEV